MAAMPVVISGVAVMMIMIDASRSIEIWADALVVVGVSARAAGQGQTGQANHDGSSENISVHDDDSYARVLCHALVVMKTKRQYSATVPGILRSGVLVSDCP